MTFELSSSTFEDGQRIPQKFTSDGDDVSPPLFWKDLPAKAKELALIVDDPDAPQNEPFVHWVLYRIPATASSIQQDDNAGGVEGLNEFGRTGWGGPKPPLGHGTHHYHFKLYALSDRIDLGEGATKEQLLAEIKGHILDQAELVGTYERPGRGAPVGR